jgi:hypothetical protein
MAATLPPDQLVPVSCATCGHQWSAPLYLPLAVSRFVKAMRGIVANGCPRCGASGRAIRVGWPPAGASAKTPATGS